MSDREPDRLIEDPSLAPFVRALQEERLAPERLEAVAQRLDARVARDTRTKLWAPILATLLFSGAAVAGVGVSEWWSTRTESERPTTHVESVVSPEPAAEPVPTPPAAEEVAAPATKGPKVTPQAKPSAPATAQLGEQVEAYQKARKLAESGKRSEAIIALEDVMRRYPRSPLLPEMLLDVAMWLEAEGQRAKAIRVLQGGLRASPQVVGYQLLADMQLRAGDCDGAASTLQAALRVGLADAARIEAGLAACRSTGADP